MQRTFQGQDKRKITKGISNIISNCTSFNTYGMRQIKELKESVMCDNCGRRKDRHTQPQADNCKMARSFKA